MVKYMKAIVCSNDNNGIGYRNTVPWKSKAHIEYVKKKVLGNGNNAVVMGHNTFRSMHYRPIPGVRNYILTRSSTLSIRLTGDVVVETCEENIWFLNFIFEEVYILGGKQIFTLFEPYIETIYMFHIKNEVVCDTYFPINLNNYIEILREKVQDPYYEIIFCEYKRILADMYR